MRILGRRPAKQSNDSESCSSPYQSGAVRTTRDTRPSWQEDLNIVAREIDMRHWTLSSLSSPTMATGGDSVMVT